jgi:hypothetical protein
VDFSFSVDFFHTSTICLSLPLRPPIPLLSVLLSHRYPSLFHRPGPQAFSLFSASPPLVTFSLVSDSNRLPFNETNMFYGFMLFAPGTSSSITADYFLSLCSASFVIIKRQMISTLDFNPSLSVLKELPSPKRRSVSNYE